MMDAYSGWRSTLQGLSEGIKQGNGTKAPNSKTQRKELRLCPDPALKRYGTQSTLPASMSENHHTNQRL